MSNTEKRLPRTTERLNHPGLLAKYLNESRGFSAVKGEFLTRLAHNQDVLRLLTDVGIPPSLAIRYAVDYHDFLDPLANEDSPKNNQRLDEFGQVFATETSRIEAEAKSKATTEAYLKGLCFARSATKLELMAENWRGGFHTALQKISQQPQAKINLEEDLFIENLNRALTSIAPNGTSVQQAASAMLTVLTNKTETVPQYLLNYRPDIFDFDLLEEVAKLEVEGIVLKIAECVVNLENPNVNKPGSVYQDALEMLSFYAPLAEIVGFDTLAMRAYDSAYKVMYPPNTLAREIYEKGRKEFSEIERKLTEALAIIPGLDTLSLRGRIKTEGSLRAKLEDNPALIEIGMVPDLMAFRILAVDEDIDPEVLANNVISALEMFNLNPSAIKKGEPEIEIAWDNYQKEVEKHLKKGNYKIKTGPPRGFNGNYQAIHIDLSGVELQITTKERFKTNQYHEGSHMLYKASMGHGQYADLRRRMQESRLPQDREAFEARTNEIVAQIKDFRNRFNVSRTHSYLTPYAVNDLRDLVIGTLPNYPADIDSVPLFRTLSGLSPLTLTEFEKHPASYLELISDPLAFKNRIKFINQPGTSDILIVTRLKDLLKLPNTFQKNENGSPLILPGKELSIAEVMATIEGNVDLYLSEFEKKFILKVLEKSKELHSEDLPRRDGTNHFNGHILPIVNLVVYSFDNLSTPEALARIATAAFHDSIESAGNSPSEAGSLDYDEQMERKAARIEEIRSFLETSLPLVSSIDTDFVNEVLYSLKALSKNPPQFFMRDSVFLNTTASEDNKLYAAYLYLVELGGEDSEIQRKLIREIYYIKGIKEAAVHHPYIIDIKIADRICNHLSDLYRLLEEADSEFGPKTFYLIDSYLDETLKYYWELFLQSNNQFLLDLISRVIGITRQVFDIRRAEHIRDNPGSWSEYVIP